MLAEMFAKLFAVHEKSLGLQFHTHEHLPRKVFTHIPGMAADVIDVPPPPRSHSINSLSDFITSVKKFSAALGDVAVFVGNDRVVAVLNHEERLHHVILELNETNRWCKAVAIATKPAVAQPRDMVKMLRYELGDPPTDVIQSLSRIDFTRTSTGKTNVAHGRESLGNSIEAMAQGIEKVPETFLLSLPIWSTHGLCVYGATIEFGIYLDVHGQLVELRVMPDELERALLASRDHLRQTLQDALEPATVLVGFP